MARAEISVKVLDLPEVQELLAEVKERQGWYERRVRALEDLLVCYRIGRAPSERLHTELKRTGAHIDDRGRWREGVDHG